MTKKDYIIFASIFNARLQSTDIYEERQLVKAIISDFVEKLLIDNPKFDVIRFEHACGL